MKKIILVGALILLPAGLVNAATDYYLKIDGIDGETSARATTSASQSPNTGITTNVSTSANPSRAIGTSGGGSGGGKVQMAASGTQEAQFDAFIKIDGVDGESKNGTSSKSKGNVDYNWKVEEGESIQESNSGKISAGDNGEPLTPDFSILLGGGSDDDEKANRGRAEAAQILVQGMQEAGQPVESLSLNYGRIKTKVAQPMKLFGLIPVSAEATVEIDADEKVKVRFPWWAFLASGKNGDTLGQQMFSTLSNVLKTKHDTIKNAIGNVR